MSVRLCLFTSINSLFWGQRKYFKVEFNVFVVVVVAAIIEIINKAMSTVTTTDDKNESIVEDMPDYSNLWEVQEFKEDDFWFMKVG